MLVMRLLVSVDRLFIEEERVLSSYHRFRVSVSVRMVRIQARISVRVRFRFVVFIFPDAECMKLHVRFLIPETQVPFLNTYAEA